MKLVIVESPTKAKTIGKFLGSGYTIRASMGHVMDLPKSKLSVDIEHDFKPQYELSADKKSVVTELKKLAKKATEVILATDPDREGEAISSHIQDILQEQKKDKKFSRIVFHEITQTAIEQALAHPGKVNTHLVDAQTARRVLDRLVGYKLSPILWQKVRRGLSAGRVQSVALRLIVEREKEIEKFVKQNYWTISVALSNQQTKGTEGTPFELIEITGEKIELQITFQLYDGQYKITKTIIADEERSQNIVEDLKTKLFIVQDVLQKQMRRSPQPPFTTSTLQQEASRRFGYSGKRTMSVAQKLYEEGCITYHRTDSVTMAQSALTQIRDFVIKKYGEKYIPQNSRFFTAKQKLAQEAHEAIRPTQVERSADGISVELGPAFGKLYDLIWRRAVASQMSDAVTQSTTVYVDAKKTHVVANVSEKSRDDNNKADYRLKANGSVLVFDGFLKINPFGLGDKKIPEFTIGERLDLLYVLAQKHETPPPPRYNDASLIGSLEADGIGRPSTYAAIIATIETRQYINRDQARFVPTPVGVAVNDFLVQHFGTIDDVPFTATMEDQFDLIAQGEKAWVPVIKSFYEPFAKTLNQVKDAQRIKIATEQTDEKCPLCGNNLVIRVGKFGKFLSCSNFPTCTFKKAYVEDTGFICPKDGGKVIARKTKKGRVFYGCANYPKCDFAVWKLTDLQKPQATTTPL